MKKIKPIFLMALTALCFSHSAVAADEKINTDKKSAVLTAPALKTSALKTAPTITAPAWIPEAPPVAQNNVAYLTLKNGSRADVLQRISTPAAGTAEMHDMSMAGGVMRMQYLPHIKLRAHQVLAFAPHGMHIMLIDMQRPLKLGERVPITLHFKHAGNITVQADVREISAE